MASAYSLWQRSGCILHFRWPEAPGTSVGVGVDSSGLLNPTLNASLAGLSTNINTPNAGTTFVQAGLYSTAKFTDNAYAYAGLSGEARSNQTFGTVNVGLRFQF